MSFSHPGWDSRSQTIHCVVPADKPVDLMFDRGKVGRYGVLLQPVLKARKAEELHGHARDCSAEIGVDDW